MRVLTEKILFMKKKSENTGGNSDMLILGVIVVMIVGGLIFAARGENTSLTGGVVAKSMLPQP